MIHTNNYTSIFIKGEVEKVGDEWVLIGKKIYEEYCKLCGEEMATELMTELFTHVIDGKKVDTEIYWGQG